jgi:ubiquinone/menaquinone biosynthesis C-methylase UbiE
MSESTEALARRIFAGRAAFYATSAAHKDPQVLARVVALAAPQRNWRVLDVATGTGHTVFAFAPHVAHVIGTDLTPDVQHRPLTSLTRDVSPDNIAWINARLAGLNEAQRQALNLVEVNGEPYINHWYVMISANK